MAYQLINEKELTELEKRIDSGDTDALDYLIKESRRVAKAANSRLLRLEKADFYESNAYQRATYYTEYTYGSERFRVNKSLSAEDLLEQYREMRTFMRKETSTVIGMRYSQKRLIETLETYDIRIPENQRKAFFKFINSDDVADALDVIGRSDIVMDAIVNNLDQIQRDFQGVLKQFQAFLRGDIFYDVLLERISGETYETLYERSRQRGIDYDTRVARRRRNKENRKQS